MVSSDTKTDWDVYLTSSYISGIVSDQEYIWAASNGGLLRWNRNTKELIQFTAPRFPLPSNNLSQVILYNGHLYISGKGGLAVFDQKSSWVLYRNADIGIKIDYYAPIAIVGNVLWIAGNDGIAKLLPDGHWETVDTDKTSFPTFNVDRIVAIDGVPYVVVAFGPKTNDRRQVVRFTNGGWEIVDRPTLLFFETPDGKLWEGKGGALLVSQDHGTNWETIFKSTAPFIEPLAYDEQGQLYASADDTIYLLKGSQLIDTFRFTSHGPELDYINILHWDDSNRLWIATDGRGLTMFDGLNWHNWQPETSGMRGDAIRGMAFANGKIYAGTFGCAGCGGLNIFDIASQQWHNFWPQESALSGGGIGGIAVDSQGRVYLPTSAGILDIYDGNNWKHIPMPLPNGYILSTSEGLFDADGNYWVGTEGNSLGLWKYDGNNWYIYHIPGDITSLALDQDQRLWVGTSQGLFVRDANHDWHHYTNAELPIGDGWIQDVAIDNEGRVWMIAVDSLLVFNGQNYKSFSPEVVGATLWGRALTFNKNGNLWLVAGDGLAQFKGSPGIGPFSKLLLPANNTIPENQIVTRP